jgi:hypothetical protein
MTDTLPEQAPICIACVGDRTNPDGGPCLRCTGTGVDPDPDRAPGVSRRWCGPPPAPEGAARTWAARHTGA